MFQINTDFLINQLHKYFYTKHLTLPLRANKKFVLFIAQVSKNIHFLPHANYFSQWMRWTIFQIYTNLLLIYQNFKIFAQKTLCPSII